MRTGKRPWRPDVRNRDLKYADFRIPGQLPRPPHYFGDELLIPSSAWGMLGNDNAGNCVWAGAAHEAMLSCAEARAGIPLFSDASVLADYSAVTGYNPSNPASDQGTDVREALLYRQKIGVADSLGVRHKIGAFVSVEPGNYEHLWEVIWIFGFAAVGLRLPEYAIEASRAGERWVYRTGNVAEAGGHYVPIIANRPWMLWRNDLISVSWGMLQHMTLSFYVHRNDETWAFISPEMLNSGRSNRGFDLAALSAALQALRAA